VIELIILVDYENVQPAAEDLADLEVGKHLLKVFHGPGQNSMPIKLATTLMPVGAAVEFIQCEKAGKDALDFHLSFHFGRLSVLHPQAQYVIVSRDRKGFAQLIEHGSKLGIKVTLVPSLRDEDMNDDGTPVAPPAPSRSPRESREPRAPLSRRNPTASAQKSQHRGTGRDAGRGTPRQAPAAAPVSAPVAQAAVAPGPTPTPPSEANEDMRVQVEQLMADIVASDEDEDTPARVEVQVAPPAPVAKKAAAKKAPAKKVAAKKVVAKKAAVKKVAAKKAPAKKVAAKKVAAKTVTAKKAPAKKVATTAVPPQVAAPVVNKAATPVPTTTAAPVPRQLRDEPMPSDTRKALDSLKRLGDGKRPVKVASLRSHLRSHLRADLSEAGVEALLDAMRAQGWISELDHGKVAYQLP
jgi:hypothetical protein